MFFFHDQWGGDLFKNEVVAEVKLWCSCMNWVSLHICTPASGCFRELCALCWMLHVRDQLSYSCRQYQKARESIKREKVLACSRIKTMNKCNLRNYHTMVLFVSKFSFELIMVYPSKLEGEWLFFNLHSGPGSRVWFLYGWALPQCSRLGLQNAAFFSVF